MAVLSVSSIAWTPAEDVGAARELRKLGIDSVDLVPWRQFANPELVTQREADRARVWWADHGLSIQGLQSLLPPGRPGLQLFDSEARPSMLKYLKQITRIAGWLGARSLVFGSPRQRDCRGVEPMRAIEIAVTFFRELGQWAHDQGTTVCFEPNSARYGCNFITTTAEAALFVRQVDSPGVRLQLDLGTIILNGEDIAMSVSGSADVAGYVHVSEPDLVAIGGRREHATFARALADALPDIAVGIEMKAVARAELGTALAAVLSVYGSRAGVPRVRDMMP